jgi:TPP-dependent indolepyruvate ferredoxin oxidoreductase alpha subunit
MRSDARSEALRNAPLNSWVALSDDETKVVAVGATYQEVAAELDRMGDNSAIILKTPDAWLPLEPRSLLTRLASHQVSN